MPKKTANLTDNNWNRIEYLLERGCYDNMKEAVNDLIRRGLPVAEKDFGVKNVMVGKV
jgi:hypothetical protein